MTTAADAPTTATPGTARKILILRRENIGDLILTTPFIRALRAHYPTARIEALVNSYNAPVLARNRDVDRVHTYTKGKHAGGWLANLWARLSYVRMLLALRRARFDDVILAEPTYTPRNIRIAGFVLAGRAGCRIVGFEDDDGQCAGLDVVASKAQMEGLHTAEIIMRLGIAYGIPTDATPPTQLSADTSKLTTLNNRPTSAPLVVALHLSARKPSQQWSVESFVALAKELVARHHVAVKLFWSPGDKDDPLHPGDDAKAAVVLGALQKQAANFPVSAAPTQSLESLIAQLAEVDMVICADGGAMHVAAALGKPIVALFGDSPAERWRPWGVPYRLLQPESKSVADLTPTQVADAFHQLLAGMSAIPPTTESPTTSPPAYPRAGSTTSE